MNGPAPQPQIPAVLRDERFWIAILGAVAQIVITQVPALAPFLDALTPAILILVGILVGGFTTDRVAAQVARKQ